MSPSSIFSQICFPVVRTAVGAVFCLCITLAAAAPVGAQDSKARELLLAHGCVGCHKIPGIPEAIGTIGPSLVGFSDRPRFAGGKLSNTPENLRRWLSNPKDVKTTLMPNPGLTEPEIDVLVEFLQTL